MNRLAAISDVLGSHISNPKSSVHVVAEHPQANQQQHKFCASSTPMVIRLCATSLEGAAEMNVHPEEDVYEAAQQCLSEHLGGHRQDYAYFSIGMGGVEIEPSTSFMENSIQVLLPVAACICQCFSPATC